MFSMEIDDLSIPEFLRVTEDTPRAPWKAPRKERKRKAARHPFHLPREIEPAGLELLKQIEGERKAKTAARLAALKALPRNPRRKKLIMPKRTFRRRRKV